MVNGRDAVNLKLLWVGQHHTVMTLEWLKMTSGHQKEKSLKAPITKEGNTWRGKKLTFGGICEVQIAVIL